MVFTLLCTQKNCPKCGSFLVQKYGRRYGRQRYCCGACKKTFSTKKKPSVQGRTLWKMYALRRATFANLATDDGRSARQLQRVVHQAAQQKKTVVHASAALPVVLVLDTTYFDTFGVMVFRCWTRRQNLFWTFVGEETNELYLAGLAHLQATGFTVVAVVCDGKRWLAEQIQAQGLPVQLCQFHFTKTMTRYLTKKPKTHAGRSLRALALAAKRMDEASFTDALTTWHRKWEAFLTEKTVTLRTGRWQYTHRNIRAAYRTAQHWLPNIFTYKKHPELGIPNTTNTLDGTFSHLKNKVQLHRGLNEVTKKKMIAFILNQPSLPKRRKNQPKSVV